MRKIRAYHAVIVKLARLLDMNYTPGELAAELGVNADTVYRSYIPAGCPYQRDGGGRLWIPGIQFAEWFRGVAEKTRPRKNRVPMANDEAFCLKCNRPVKLINPRRRSVKRNVVFLTAKCPICGTTVNRTQSARKVEKSKKPGKQEKAEAEVIGGR